MLPKYLQKFQPFAQQCVSCGCVRDIEFAGGTYQVLVFDQETKKEEWVFFQLDERAKLKDSFCTCSEEESKEACLHLAIAWLYINGSHGIPLHIRFENSLWNRLCSYCSEHVGNDAKAIKNRGNGLYVSAGKEGKQLFSIKAQTEEMNKRLKKMFFERKEQTEETSLKFSNLPQEEIVLWRQGNPSLKLSYELSFWNDLAKLLMFWQENALPYTIAFPDSTSTLPSRLQVGFPEIELEYALSQSFLLQLIPSFATVASPLAVHSTLNEAIEKIIYDKKQKALQIIPKNPLRKQAEKPAQGIEIPGWIFVPQDGFYPTDPHFLLTKEQLKGRFLENALNEHTMTIKGMLEGCKVHDVPVPLSHAITFDSQWNLHIDAYLFHPGDLSPPHSYCLQTWGYLENDGFYRLEERYFDTLHMIVPHSEVSDFVTEHRSWLSNQAGFSTHLSYLEADLSYEVTPNLQLIFSRNLENGKSESKDFGRWVYTKGEGFFSKKTTLSHLPVQNGTPIIKERIPIFIKENEADLRFVKGFFLSQCPVVKSTLKIALNKNEQIEVTPEHELLPDYQKKNVHFFDEFIYVEGEGFCELPVALRLPEAFREPVTISGERLQQFLQVDLLALEPFIGSIDQKLIKGKSPHFFAASVEYGELQSKGDYRLGLEYRTEYGSISVASLWWSIKQNKRFIFSEAGLVDLSEKRFSWLQTLKKSQVDRRQNVVDLTTLELMRLNAWNEIVVEPGDEKEGGEKQPHTLLDELKQCHVPQDLDLQGLNSELRPYQRKGVDWLWFLYRHGLSGLLCDDMGLGKTHQTMALLVAVTNLLLQQNDGKKRHFLIICPTSVIYHWQEKLQKFLPHLRVWTFYGAKRSLESFYDESDILLTSYGIWRNEQETLKKYVFEVAVFDEIQVAKNHASRMYHSLSMVRSRMRLGLSGTPIENRLRELKTLFDLVLPTYMPTEADYREYFVRPIEKEGDADKKALLSRLIKPFVLRRKKEDVLPDLPEKIEEIAHCDLLEEQHHLYVQVLTAARDKIIDDLRDDKAPIPYMHIFALLSHLKQICNHPAAYFKQPQEYKKYVSGKWELFVELLNEARESQQKVVVFSQYLSMLDIIELYLKENSIGFAAIRGATTNRGDQLQRFKDDPNCEVFVASLQAAGLGVDLTSASVVIHYDRWWNAAKENQATDRVHRIGQTRGVQVFKLMTKHTIEEHIDSLISKKGKLMEEIIGVDDHQLIKIFDRQEIIQLLQKLS